MDEDILALQARMRELRAKIRICNDDLLDIQLRSGERDKLVEDLLYKPIHHFNTTLTSYQEELDKIKQRRQIQQDLEISDFEYLCKVAGLKAKIAVYQENLDYFLRERKRREARTSRRGGV